MTFTCLFVIIIYRLQTWKDNKLDRTLISLPTDEPTNTDPFPTTTKTDSRQLKQCDVSWFINEMITGWFQQRTALASVKNGKILYLGEFLKTFEFVKIAKDDYCFFSQCSAQTKKRIDYGVKIHVSKSGILKATCECPAGAGLSASCKHIAALACGVQYFGVTGKY